MSGSIPVDANRVIDRLKGTIAELHVANACLEIRAEEAESRAAEAEATIAGRTVSVAAQPGQ